MTGVEWEVAEIGRLLHAHRIDAELVAAALQINDCDAGRLKQGDPGAHHMVGCPDSQVSLLLNVLIRLEIRSGYDSVAMRGALERPVDALGGDSIADQLLGHVDTAALRVLREVAGTVPVPRVKFWRCADRYS